MWKKYRTTTFHGLKLQKIQLERGKRRIVLGQIRGRPGRRVCGARATKESRRDGVAINFGRGQDHPHFADPLAVADFRRSSWPAPARLCAATASHQRRPDDPTLDRPGMPPSSRLQN
jgi:hypothetical protein